MSPNQVQAHIAVHTNKSTILRTYVGHSHADMHLHHMTPLLPLGHVLKQCMNLHAHPQAFAMCKSHVCP